VLYTAATTTLPLLVLRQVYSVTPPINESRKSCNTLSKRTSSFPANYSCTAAQELLLDTNDSVYQIDLFLESITLSMTTKENIITALRSNKAVLSKLGVQTIGLFGSYARNEQSDNSDVDLLIDFEPEKETFDNYMAVYDLFESIFQNEKIEVVTKNGLSPYIGPKILKEVVYV
jgi:predicted nucleotidyltransferase